MSKVSKKQIQRRSEIIEAVIPLISSNSFEDISVAEICQVSGISIGTFYHYFNKKSDMLVGLLGLIDEDLEERVYPLLVSEYEPNNLKMFAHGWAEHVAKHGIERSKLISGSKTSDVDFGGHKRSSKNKIEEIIREGQKKGQITCDYKAEKLAELVLLAIRGVTTDWSRNDGEYSVVERMDEFFDLFLRSLKI